MRDDDALILIGVIVLVAIVLIALSFAIGTTCVPVPTWPGER